MSLFLDSADLADITRAQTMGMIRGLTMNPSLLRPHTDVPLTHLRAVLEASAGQVMYQPTKVHRDALDEALRAYELSPDRVVIKVPVTRVDLPVAADLVRREIPVALTAVLAPGQMLVAEAIGAAYVICYVDRAARDPRGGAHLVRELDSVRRGPVVIVAASVKSAAQAVQARLDGAEVVSTPVGVLGELASHPMSQEAADDFDAEYSGNDAA